MSLIDKLRKVAEDIKEKNHDIPNESDILQNFVKALELEEGTKFKTITNKGKTALIKTIDIIKISVGSSPWYNPTKGKVGKSEAIEALLRWNITKTGN